MKFIRCANYEAIGMVVKAIEVTMYYAGNFNKEEVVVHLVANEGFRAGTDKRASRMIVDHDEDVGWNCLTFMERIDGMTTRPNIYNNMVQMLECKSVRSSVGCHQKNWVCQREHIQPMHETGQTIAGLREQK